MELSHEAFNYPSYDPVLPQIPQDESLIHALNDLTDTAFPQYHDNTLENFDVLSSDALQFTTGNPPTTRVSTPSPSDHSQDIFSSLPLYQDSPVRSEPCTPQLHHQLSRYNFSKTESSFPYHLQRLNYFNPALERPPSHHVSPPNPPTASTHERIPHYTLHRRSQSQPPEEAPFFLPPRRPTTRLPASHPSRWRRHPYPRPSSSRTREHPTSAPPPPPSPVAQAQQSPPLPPPDAPRFARMQAADAQSPRAIEVGAARVIAGSSLAGVLVAGVGVGVGVEVEVEERCVGAGQAAAALGLVAGIERQLREALGGCGLLRGMLARPRMGEGDTEVGAGPGAKPGTEGAELLPLRKHSTASAVAPELDAFIEALPQL